MIGKFRSFTAGEIMLGPVVTAPGDVTASQAWELVAIGDYKGIVLMSSQEVVGACSREYLARIEQRDTTLFSLDYCRRIKVVSDRTTIDELIAHISKGLAFMFVVSDPDGVPAGIIEFGDLANFLWRRLNIAAAMLQSVVDTVNEAITIIDHEEKVAVWNRRAEELYNIPAEEITGRSINSFFTRLVATTVFREGQEVRNSYHQPCDGTHVLINAGPILDGDSLLGSISAERDITELVHLHQDLSKATTQVRLLEKEINNINGRNDPFQKILGHSRLLAASVTIARRVADTNVSVLIRGESGTGKDLFAEAIHKAGGRNKKPFIIINCGAIPSTLFESELFGYEKGAFTGADRKGKPGKFELAHGGTVFLDEIGELPAEMQVKLLRVIQQNVFYRVGGNEPVNVDVRIIAATHRNLEEMITRNHFREDLYYRLNVVSLEVPPLRERKEDIPELVYTFIQEFSRQHGRNITQVDPELMSLLLNYSWPGNVRELRNVLERLVILSESGTITAEHAPKSLKSLARSLQGSAGKTGRTVTDITRNAERELIVKALREAGGNKAKAARALGIPRSTLYYRIKVLKLDQN